METRKRRSYTQEFREEAVKLVTEQGYTIAEASRSLGIHPNVLGRWKRNAQDVGTGGASSGAAISTQAELKRLRKENKGLRMEREVLKKAMAFFAKEPG